MNESGMTISSASSDVDRSKCRWTNSIPTASPKKRQVNEIVRYGIGIPPETQSNGQRTRLRGEDRPEQQSQKNEKGILR